MNKKLFSSQLRINMFSGVVTTVINIVLMAVAFPIYPELTKEQIEEVVKAIKSS